MADVRRGNQLPRWFGFVWAFVAVTAATERRWLFAAMAMFLAAELLLPLGAEARRKLGLAGAACAVLFLTAAVWGHFAS